jgi:hypothetical protein
MRISYPSPCNTCDGQSCGCGGYGCVEWKKYFLTHWKWINLKAVKLCHPEPKPENKFLIAHPNEIRRYLTTHPCEGCFVKNICDTPCPRYLRWYNERMAYARKKVEL